MTVGDAWNTACRLADKANCPDEKAPDFDFSSPPILVPLASSLGSNADPKAGGGMFAFNLQTGQRVWYAPPAPCGTRPRCSPAQSAAVSAIPGVVFSGSVDGHLRGYSTTDGRVIFDFDSVGRLKPGDVLLAFSVDGK